MPIFKKRIKKKICVAAAVFICLAPVMLPKWGNGGGRGSVYAPYIALITSEDMEDRPIAEKLSAAGIKNVLSESSQWFFLNDFSELRRVPLDEFSDVLMESDPRNDGYAQRLKALFTRDDRRYFYIPAASFNSPFPVAPAAIENRIKNALEGIRHSVVFATSSEWGSNFILIYATAAFLSLVAAFFASKSTANLRARTAFTLSVAALLPACGLLTGQGPAGFALAAPMLVLFLTLQAPFESFFARFRFDSPVSYSYTEHFKRFLQDEKKTLIFLAALILAVCIAGKISIFNIFRAILFFCLSAAARAFAENAVRGSRNHVVFAPVAIRPRRIEKTRLILAAFPFTLASAAALVMPLFHHASVGDLPARLATFTASTGGLPAIGAGDYEAHVNFQKNFTLRRLTRAEPGTATTQGNGVYMNFEQDGGGLLYPATDSQAFVPGLEKNTTDIPPFPLENLIAFLNGEGGGETLFVPVVLASGRCWL
ncbi:MAG: hypothetical protein LBF80_04520 [Spirochaetaceae bacterium]|jgi:hypothetical protein|nr:hypothetical protein [Spirochaetaceae bacterium]